MQCVRRSRMSVSDKAAMWERWKRGESLSEIGRALDRTPGAIFHVPLCQRDVRQLHLDIFVPMGGEWSSEGAQTILGSRSREAHRGRACAR